MEFHSAYKERSLNSCASIRFFRKYLLPIDRSITEYKGDQLSLNYCCTFCKRVTMVCWSARVFSVSLRHIFIHEKEKK
jgi:hypothetical protein